MPSKSSSWRKRLRDRDPPGASTDPRDATASSAHEIDFAGVPATCSEPFSATMSSAAASRRCAAIFCARLSTSVEARKIAEPAVCSDREPSVPAPRGTVSVSELTSLILIHRDAEDLGRQHCERRVVALPVHAGAGEHAGRAVVVNLGRTELDVQTDRRGDFDVARHTDAERDRIVRGTPAGLLGSKLVVTRCCQDRVERLLVLARVVGGAGVGGQRELVGLDEVAPTELGGIHPDLAGGDVDHSLDQLRGFGPARAAVRADRCRVGHDGIASRT